MAFKTSSAEATHRLYAQTLKPLSFMFRIKFWPCFRNSRYHGYRYDKRVDRGHGRKRKEKHQHRDLTRSRYRHGNREMAHHDGQTDQTNIGATSSASCPTRLIKHDTILSKPCAEVDRQRRDHRRMEADRTRSVHPHARPTQLDDLLSTSLLRCALRMEDGPTVQKTF